MRSFLLFLDWLIDLGIAFLFYFNLQKEGMPPWHAAFAGLLIFTLGRINTYVYHIMSER